MDQKRVRARLVDVDVLRALAEAPAGPGGVVATDLADELDLPVSVAAPRLTALAKTGLARREWIRGPRARRAYAITEEGLSYLAQVERTAAARTREGRIAPPPPR